MNNPSSGTELTFQENKVVGEPRLLLKGPLDGIFLTLKS